MSQIIELSTQLHQHLAARPLASNNPFDGVAPNFSIFGVQFNAWWKKMLAGLWGLAIIVCAAKLFPAALSMHRSRSVGNAVSLSESSAELKLWGVGTLVVIAAGIIFGAVVAAAG